MLKPATYLTYLETIVLSLLAERDDKKDIVVNDKQASPSMAGFTCSPYNVREEIQKQRTARSQS